MGQSTKVPWEAMKLEYVHNPQLSLRQVAKNHGINHRTVQHRAKKDGWAKERKAFLGELASKFRQKAGTKLTSTAEQTVRDTLEGMQVLRGRLMEQVIEQLRPGAPPEVVGDTVVEETGPGGTKRIRRALQRHKLNINDPGIQRLLQHEMETVRMLLGSHAQTDVRHHITVQDAKDIVEQIFTIICEEVEDDDVRRRVAVKLQRISLGAGGSAGPLPPSDTLAIHARVVEGGAA